MLEQIDANERALNSAVKNHRFTPSSFHGSQAPSITPSEYLQRLVRYAYCSRSAFVVAFCYLDRCAQKGLGLSIDSLSVHRLLLTAVLLATKYVDDILYDNAHFAKVGGLELQELNALEVDMLRAMDFGLHITKDEFNKYEQQMLNTVLRNRNPEYTKLRWSLSNMGYRVPKEAPGSPSSVFGFSGQN